MKQITLIISFFLFISCSTRNNKDVLNTESISTQDSSKIEVISNENEPVDNKLSSNVIYVYENEMLKQTVTVNYINNNTFTFKLISYNKQIDKSAIIEGTAEDKSSDLAVEIDEDEDGNAYPVIEYIYSGDCWLSFRIDLETRKTMRITLADCEEDLDCPFTSIEVLQKIK